MGGNLVVQSLLVADATYSAIADKVYYDEADQTIPTPFGIVRLDEVQPNDDKTGVSHFDFDMVTVLHFSSTALEAHEMAVAARNALDRKTAGTYNSIVIDSIQFQTQRSGSEFIDNHKILAIEQIYKIITRP